MADPGGVMEQEWYAKKSGRTERDASQPLLAGELAATTGADLVGLTGGGRTAKTNVGDALAEDALFSADLRVVDAVPGAEAANAIEVACQIRDVFGSAVSGARQVVCRSLAVTADKGDLDAAGTPVGTLVKAHNPAAGENVAWFETAAGGTFTVKVSNDQAETTVLVIEAEGCRPKVVKLTFT